MGAFGAFNFDFDDAILRSSGGGVNAGSRRPLLDRSGSFAGLARCILTYLRPLPVPNWWISLLVVQPI